jgi:6-phosphogluconolactonase (cycloisomerase 2 family)
MHHTISRAAVALPIAAAGLATVGVSPPSFAATAGHQAVPGAHSVRADDGAVFVQTDDLDHNSVVAFRRDRDGALHRVGEFFTGGRGGVEQDVPLDSLASQDSLTYDRSHRLLFAVNAGSNTVTSFRVDGAHLRRLETVRSGGVFPVSVSAGHDRLWVLNAGGSGNLTGYRIQRSGHLDALSGGSRDLGLSNEARPAFITAPADVVQTRDGRQVVVTTKANDTIDVFNVRDGRLAAPVENHSAAEVPFAASFDSHGRLAVANAGNSSLSTYRLHRDGSLATITAGVEDGQAALCWLVGTGETFFGGNAGSSTISAFAVAGNGTASLTGAPDGVVAHTGGGTGGTIDLAITADERLLYAENSFAGTVEGYRIGRDHTLHLASTATGLPQFDCHGMEGLVAL